MDRQEHSVFRRSLPLGLDPRWIPGSPQKTRQTQQGRTSQRTAENEERSHRNKAETDGVVPGHGLLEIKEREAGEDQQRDHLLDGLELRRGIDRAAPAVR